MRIGKKMVRLKIVFRFIGDTKKEQNEMKKIFQFVWE